MTTTPEIRRIAEACGNFEYGGVSRMELDVIMAKFDEKINILFDQAGGNA